MTTSPLTTTLHPPPYGQRFAVMWSNNDAFTRDMARHTLTLRNQDGITCDALHLDQVQILFRPSGQIDASEFEDGDTPTHTFKAETASLMLRCSPGVQHILFTSGGGPEPLARPDETVVKQPVQTLAYSASLAMTPNTEGTEDYWQRTYRPIRDLPVAHGLQNCTLLDLELLFPYLQALGLRDDGTLYLPRRVPNYRIVKVLCEFSYH